jgi:hypothetical protein
MASPVVPGRPIPREFPVGESVDAMRVSECLSRWELLPSASSINLRPDLGDPLAPGKCKRTISRHGDVGGETTKMLIAG